jgi:hypothetical protein
MVQSSMHAPWANTILPVLRTRRRSLTLLSVIMDSLHWHMGPSGRCAKGKSALIGHALYLSNENVLLWRMSTIKTNRTRSRRHSCSAARSPLRPTRNEAARMPTTSPASEGLRSTGTSGHWLVTRTEG